MCILKKPTRFGNTCDPKNFNITNVQHSNILYRFPLQFYIINVPIVFSICNQIFLPKSATIINPVYVFICC